MGTLLEDSREVGIEVYTEKTMYVVVCLVTKTQHKIIIYWLLINPCNIWQI
jgi:hypothetical protein